MNKALVFIAGILTGALGIFLCDPFGAAKRMEAAPLIAGQDSEKVRELLKARLEAVKTEHDAREKEFLAGRGTLEILLNSTARLLSSELELARKHADRLAAYQAHLDRTEEYRKVNQARFDTGRIPIQDKSQTDYSRFDAEIMLERAKNR